MESSDSIKTGLIDKRTVIIEKVIPDDGRRESLWLISSIAIILFFAAITLHYNQADRVEPARHQELGITGKAVLTALRNAGDEIQFMMEQPDNFPSVNELIEAEVPPFADNTGAFASYQWSLLNNHCYLGTPADSDYPEFLLFADSDHPHIYWRYDRSTAVDCSTTTHWQSEQHHHD